MSDDFVTREEMQLSIDTDRRITAIEVSNEDFKNFVKETKRQYRADQKFNIRLIVGMMFVVAIAFLGAAYNTLSVSSTLSDLLIKVERIETDVASLKTNQGMLQSNQEMIFDRLTSLEDNQEMIFDRLTSLEDNQERIIVALEGAKIEIIR